MFVKITSRRSLKNPLWWRWCPL